jgi:hypothetical protein
VISGLCLDRFAKRQQITVVQLGSRMGGKSSARAFAHALALDSGPMHAAEVRNVNAAIRADEELRMRARKNSRREGLSVSI